MDQDLDKESVRIHQRLSYAQKWQTMLSIREFAWNVKKAGVRMQHPDWPPEKVENTVKELFLNATT